MLNCGQSSNACQLVHWWQCGSQQAVQGAEFPKTLFPKESYKLY